MDSGKLPNYRSSYLLRFHPYPRVKPSARERAMAAMTATEDDTLLSQDVHSATYFRGTDDVFNTTTKNLNSAITFTESIDTSQRRLSLSSLVVDLAHLLARKPTSGA